MKAANKNSIDSAMDNAMTYKGYTVSITFDADDRILVGRVLHIDDIISFHGESVTEFEAAFHDSVDGYIASCEKLGQVQEKPASGRMMLRVNPSVHAAALQASAKEHQSLNKWVEQVLRQAVHV